MMRRNRETASFNTKSTRPPFGEQGYKDEMADLIIEQLDIQLEKDDIPGLDATTWLYV
jgi:hypothetical protein